MAIFLLLRGGWTDGATDRRVCTRSRHSVRPFRPSHAPADRNRTAEILKIWRAYGWPVRAARPLETTHASAAWPCASACGYKANADNDDDKSSVFVRNLPFDCTDASLEEHFGEAGPVRGAFGCGRDKKTKAPRLRLCQLCACRRRGARGRAPKRQALQGRPQPPSTSPRRVPTPRRKRTAAQTTTGPAAAGDGGSSKGGGSSSKAGGGSSGSGDKSGGSQDEKAAKALRLIVRNLSFKCDEAALRAAFAPHGTVLDAHLPTRPDGKHPGFGFVQMSSRAECDAAVKAVNESKIVGRLVAVDHALGKAHSERAQSKEQGKEEPEAAADDEEEDDDEEDGGGEESEGEEEEEEEDEEAAAAAKAAEKEAVKAAAAKDSEQLTRTLFARGLPLQANEASLRAALEQISGGYSLQYVTIVRDSATKLSKGTAFACFGKVEGMQVTRATASKPHSLATAPITPHTLTHAPLSLPFCDVVCAGGIRRDGLHEWQHDTPRPVHQFNLR